MTAILIIYFSKTLLNLTILIEIKKYWIWLIVLYIIYEDTKKIFFKNWEHQYQNNNLYTFLDFWNLDRKNVKIKNITPFICFSTINSIITKIQICIALDFFILELFNVKIENKKKTTFALYFIDFPQFIANSFKKKNKKNFKWRKKNY
jgi:hypothetical protein